jgi:hypothetical protein
MKKITILLTLIIAYSVGNLNAQVAITDDGSMPDNSAMLDIQSADKGLLIPRMTIAERDAILSPANGLLVFVTDDNQFYYNSGTSASPNWTTTGGDDGDWVVTGSDMHSSVSGNVGIGTVNPTMPLEVMGSSWQNIVKVHDGNYYGNALIFSNGAQWASISGSTSNRDDIVIKHETGEVGIGRTFPAAKLDVNGSIRMTDGNEGEGKVLVSNSSGVGSWQTITAGSSELDDLSDAINDGLSIFIGTGSGINDNGSNYNTSLGNYSLSNNTFGFDNVAIGDSVLSKNVGGSGNWGWEYGTWNTAVGSKALLNNSSGSKNTAIGWSTLKNNETGKRNVAVGYGAGFTATGNDNLFLGSYAGYYETGDNKLYIENSNSQNPLIYGDFENDSVRINGELTIEETIKIEGGNPGVGKVLTSDANGIASWQTISAGTYEINDLSDAIYDGTSIFLGNEAGIADDGTNYNLAFGKESLKANTEGQHNTAIGYKSLTTNISGNKNVGLGINTLRGTTSGSNNVAIGYIASYSNTIGYSNTAVGIKALYSGTYQHNLVAIGDSALMKNGLGASLPDDGADNTAVGSKALYANTVGHRNTAIGSLSMELNQEGDFNTALGYASLRQNTQGNGNTAIGNAAMAVNTNGENNTVLGSGGLFLNNNGDNNVAIGRNAGFSNVGSGNVFIGHEAGYSESGSNTLYIDNSNTNNPLIKGDFSANSLKINGELTIAEKTQIENGSDASITGGGYLTLGLESGKNICIDDNEIMARNNGVGSALYFQHAEGASNTIINNYDGNVGIGTSAPSAKLHVYGNAKISDDLEVGDDIVAADDITADEFKYGATKTCILKIPAAAFSLSTNQDADRMFFEIDGYWHIDNDDGNGSYFIKAGVNLPDGAIVTRFSFYYRCEGEWITVKLKKKDDLSWPADDMASFVVNYNYFNLTKFDDSTISYSTIDNGSNSYYITAEFNGHDQLDFGQFHGAEIEYTIDKISQ